VPESSSVPAGPGVVLHVVEAWGGGVASAIYDYVSSTPGWTHVLLATLRPKHNTHELDDHKNVTFRSLPAGKVAAMRVIAREYRHWQPAVVHVHSSFAGVLARLSPSVPRSRIVYTPHCYAFERLDLPAPTRGVLRMIEKVLAPATGTVAACSPREAELAVELLGSRHARPDAVFYVPNVVRLAPAAKRLRHGEADISDRNLVQRPLRVAAVGRLSPQKDPDFFRAVVAAARAVQPDIQWQWLGGDPPERVTQMRAEGIDVTGWVPRETVLSELAKADIYLHTAAWEGAPVAALEAAALGLPVVARRIPALTSLSMDLLGDTPHEVAQLILGLRDPLEREKALLQSEDLTRRHAPARQQAALEHVYATVAARNRASGTVVAASVRTGANSEAGSEV
jgi:glycosyltransferase involved in cell wall biosynthesis